MYIGWNSRPIHYHLHTYVIVIAQCQEFMAVNRLYLIHCRTSVESTSILRHVLPSDTMRSMSDDSLKQVKDELLGVVTT